MKKLILLVGLIFSVNGYAQESKPTYKEAYDFASCMWVAQQLGATVYLWKHTSLVGTKFDLITYQNLQRYSADIIGQDTSAHHLIHTICKELKFHTDTSIKGK